MVAYGSVGRKEFEADNPDKIRENKNTHLPIEERGRGIRQKLHTAMWPKPNNATGGTELKHNPDYTIAQANNEEYEDDEELTPEEMLERFRQDNRSPDGWRNLTEKIIDRAEFLLKQLYNLDFNGPIHIHDPRTDKELAVFVEYGDGSEYGETITITENTTKEDIRRAVQNFDESKNAHFAHESNQEEAEASFEQYLAELRRGAKISDEIVDNAEWLLNELEYIELDISITMWETINENELMVSIDYGDTERFLIKITDETTTQDLKRQLETFEKEHKQ